MTKRIEVDGHSLTCSQVTAVARHRIGVEPNPEAFENIKRFRKGLEQAIDRGDVMYGVNTGVGSRKNEILTAHELSDYQMKYIPAHCCGCGQELPVEVVRAAMLIRLNNFLKGHSGVRPVLIERLRDCLNLGLTPMVPEYGSVGASGDLIPLAHMSAAIIGLPQAWMRLDTVDDPLSAPEALHRCGLHPLRLAAKEAMGLTNGVNFMTALACLTVEDGWAVLQAADLAAALSLEAIRGETNAFDERIHQARSFPGQVHSASRIRSLLAGSRRVTSAARECNLRDEVVPASGKVPRVQDAYSFRCAPQIHAAAYDALQHLQSLVEIELNSATDNPLVFPDEDQPDQYVALSGGNFHGQPLAAPLDYLAIALLPLAGVSDRRTFALTVPKLSYGLPADVAGPQHGNTGLMITQYGAAALVNQLGLLANPTSIHSITTSGDQEDWVSMGMTSALKVRAMIPLIRHVLATELHAASQGIELTNPQLPVELQQLGVGTSAAYARIREVFSSESAKPLENWFGDRYLKSELDRVSQMLADGSLFQVMPELQQ